MSAARGRLLRIARNRFSKTSRVVEQPRQRLDNLRLALNIAKLTRIGNLADIPIQCKRARRSSGLQVVAPASALAATLGVSVGLGRFAPIHGTPWLAAPICVMASKCSDRFPARAPGER